MFLFLFLIVFFIFVLFCFFFSPFRARETGNYTSRGEGGGWGEAVGLEDFGPPLRLCIIVMIPLKWQFIGNQFEIAPLSVAND